MNLLLFILTSVVTHTQGSGSVKVTLPPDYAYEQSILSENVEGDYFCAPYYRRIASQPIEVETQQVRAIRYVKRYPGIPDED